MMALRLIALCLLIFTIGLSMADIMDVCFTGWVMDQYCIDRGTLLDNSSAVTLEWPEIHSFHCLIDVDVCRESQFNLLTVEGNSRGFHCRSFLMDDNGRNMAVDMAKEVGICDICSGSGDLVRGFMATVKGTYDSKAATPALITVTEIMDGSNKCPVDQTPSECQTVSKMLYVHSELADCEGANGMTKCMQVAECSNCEYELFYGDIEGFTFEEGTSYVLEVMEEPVPDAPADAPSRRTILMTILSESFHDADYDHLALALKITNEKEEKTTYQVKVEDTQGGSLEGMNLVLSSSGDIKIKKVKTDDCYKKNNGNYQCDIEEETEKVKFKVVLKGSGEGKFTVKVRNMDGDVVYETKTTVKI